MTIRRLLTISTLALALATPAPASAAPSRKDKAKDASRAAEEADEATIVERALKEWASGNWVGVRSLLEPLVSGGLALLVVEVFAVAVGVEHQDRALVDHHRQEQAGHRHLLADGDDRAALASRYLRRPLEYLYNMPI